MAFACAECVCFISKGINQRRDSNAPAHPPTQLVWILKSRSSRGGIASAPSCQDVKYMRARGSDGCVRAAPSDYLFTWVSSLKPSPRRVHFRRLLIADGAYMQRRRAPASANVQPTQGHMPASQRERESDERVRWLCSSVRDATAPLQSRARIKSIFRLAKMAFVLAFNIVACEKKLHSFHQVNLNNIDSSDI